LTVRTTLLASGRRTDATLAVVYTCPDGTTAILKRLVAMNISTTVTLDFLVALDAGAFNQTPWFEQAIAPRARVSLDTWQVLLPGMEIAIRGDVDGSINYWLSGTELLGIAP
jgi:hypothetical protein